MQTEPAVEKTAPSAFRELFVRGILVFIAIILVSGFGAVACSDIESRPSIDAAISQTMADEAAAKPTAMVRAQ